MRTTNATLLPALLALALCASACSRPTSPEARDPDARDAGSPVDTGSVVEAATDDALVGDAADAADAGYVSAPEPKPEVTAANVTAASLANAQHFLSYPVYATPAADAPEEFDRKEQLTEPNLVYVGSARTALPTDMLESKARTDLVVRTAVSDASFVAGASSTVFLHAPSGKLAGLTVTPEIWVSPMDETVTAFRALPAKVDPLADGYALTFTAPAVKRTVNAMIRLSVKVGGAEGFVARAASVTRSCGIDGVTAVRSAFDAASDELVFDAFVVRSATNRPETLLAARLYSGTTPLALLTAAVNGDLAKFRVPLAMINAGGGGAVSLRDLDGTCRPDGLEARVPRLDVTAPATAPIATRKLTGIHPSHGDGPKASLAGLEEQAAALGLKP
jgi:hypothetical protein